MENDSAQIVSDCLAKVPGSFTRLVHRFRDQVFTLCFRILQQREDAEDATQETFMRVINNLHRWDSSRKFEPWIYTIAGNRCRTKLRKRVRQKEIQLSSTTECDQPAQPMEGITEEIAKAIEFLGPKHREAFQLFHHQQCSYIEIAEKMNVPVGTIKTWVHRARKQIADSLKRRKTLEMD